MATSILVIEPVPSFVGKGEVRGFLFTRVFADKNGFIYKVEDAGKMWYEVFLCRRHGQHGHVMYPKAKAFGRWAWCAATYEEALKILKLRYDLRINRKTEAKRQ